MITTSADQIASRLVDAATDINGGVRLYALKTAIAQELTAAQGEIARLKAIEADYHDLRRSLHGVLGEPDEDHDDESLAFLLRSRAEQAEAHAIVMAAKADEAIRRREVMERQLTAAQGEIARLKAEREALHQFPCGHFAYRIRRGDGTLTPASEEPKCFPCRRAEQAEAERARLREALTALIAELVAAVDPAPFGLETSWLVYTEARKECAEKIAAALSTPVRPSEEPPARATITLEATHRGRGEIVPPDGWEDPQG